jgi:cysteine synthase A
LGKKDVIYKARSIIDKTPNPVMPEQFANQANSDIHFNNPAQEICRDTPYCWQG